MIKILYILSSLEHTGPTIQLLNIIKYLNRKKFIVHVLTLSPEKQKSLKSSFIDLKVKFSSLKLSRIGGLFFTNNKVLNLINNIQPHLIHTMGIRADFFTSLLKQSVPVVRTIHNFPAEDYTNRYGKLAGNIVTKFHENIIKKSNNAYACSKNLSKRFKNRGININFVQNGVDDKIYALNKDKKKLRQYYNLPINETILIFSGPLDKIKNISLVIKVLNKINSLHFIILGDGVEKSKLLKQANQNPKIHFWGWRENIKDFYILADYYVSASFSEGLSNSVMEAMLCGLPVILSDIMSHHEFFEGIEYNYFFDPFNVSELKHMISDIISSDYSQLSKKMKKIIKDKFTAKLMSEKYQKIYLDVVNKRNN